MKLASPGLASRTAGTLSNALNARVREAGKRQRESLFDQDADHPQRGAAKPEPVLFAGGKLADAEHARERLELVGERDGLRNAALRKRIAGEAWPVVLRDRVGDDARARRRAGRNSGP